MHEYSLMQDIIQTILERLDQEEAGGVVDEVILKLGVLDIHSEAAARQAFEILARGTPLENSRLTVVVNPVIQECPACHLAVPIQVDEHTHAHDLLPVRACAACGAWARLTGGQGVEAIELVFAGEEPENDQRGGKL